MLSPGREDLDQHQRNWITISPSGLRALSQNYVSTIKGVFFFFFSMPMLLFSQKGFSWGSKILHGVLTHPKNKILGEIFFGPPHPCPRGGQFFRGFFQEKKEKFLESPEMGRKLIGIFFKFVDPPSQTCASINLS